MQDENEQWNAQNHEQLTTTAVFCCNKQIQNNHLFRTWRARDRAWYCIRGLRPRSPITTTAALPLFPIILPLPITKQNHLFLSLLTPNLFFGKLAWLSNKEELIFDTRKNWSSIRERIESSLKILKEQNDGPKSWIIILQKSSRAQHNSMKPTEP
jgi:hypothetical protein